MSDEEEVTVQINAKDAFLASHKIISALDHLKDVEQGLAVATAVVCLFSKAAPEFLSIVQQMVPQVAAQIGSLSDESNQEEK